MEWHQKSVFTQLSKLFEKQKVQTVVFAAAALLLRQFAAGRNGTATISLSYLQGFKLKGSILKDVYSQRIAVLRNNMTIPLSTDSVPKKDLFASSEDMEQIADSLQSIFDDIPHGVADLRNRKVIFANKVMKDIFGWGPEELIGQDIRVLFRSDEDYEEIGRRFYQILEHNKTHCEELPFRRRNGEDIVCMVGVVRIGDFLRDKMIVVAYMEVTERLRVRDLQQRLYDELEEQVRQRTKELQHKIDEQMHLNRELRKSEERYRQLTETSPDYIVTIDFAGNIVYANRSFLMMSGYSEKDLSKLNMEDVVATKDIPLFKARIKKRSAGDDLVYFTEFEAVTKHGTTIPVEVTCSLVKEKGKPSGILIIGRNISQRRLLKDALEESEDQYRQLSEMMDDPVVVFTLDGGRLLCCNEATALFYGYNKEELLRIDPLELVHQNSEKIRRESIKKLARGQIAFTEELHRCKDGRLIPVKVNARPIKYRGRHAVLAMIRSIARETRKDTIEREPAISKEQGTSARYGADMGMYDIEMQSRTFHADEQFWKMIGYRQGDIAHTLDEWRALIHPDDLERIPQIFTDHCTDERDLFSAEYRLRHKCGRWKWIQMKGRIVTRDAAGCPLRVSGSHNDISTIKRAELPLTESGDTYRRILEFTKDIIWEIDDQDRYTYISPRVEDITGYRPEEVLGMTPCFFADAKETGRVSALFRAVKKKRNMFIHAEFTVRAKDGSNVILEASGYPFYDEDGTFRGYRGFHRNQTRRKRMEYELVKKDEELVKSNICLQEANAALKAFLKHQENEKREIESTIIDHIEKLVIPYAEKLKLTRLDEYQAFCLNILISNLHNVTSPMLNEITQQYAKFTPREIEIADYIKGGLTSKDIARIMNVSIRAVEFHRNRIRSKLGLNNKKSNLRSHLLIMK